MWICLHACEFEYTVKTFLSISHPAGLVRVHENTHLSSFPDGCSSPHSIGWSDDWHRCVRGAEDLATKRISSVTKWTVPTTWSRVVFTSMSPPHTFLLLVQVHYHKCCLYPKQPTYFVALFFFHGSCEGLTGVGGDWRRHERLNCWERDVNISRPSWAMRRWWRHVYSSFQIQITAAQHKEKSTQTFR